LLEAARSGDRAAAEALLDRHQAAVYRFARRMCARPEDARDVLQETLLAAWRGLPAFRGDASLVTWLFQIARSFCTKARRTRVGEPRMHEALDATDVVAVPTGEADSPQARAQAHEVTDVLRAALASMPDHYREVLLLKDAEGLSAEEVAAVLGEKVPGVKSRLHRARLELRRLLDGVLEESLEGGEACPELAEELAGEAGGDVDRVTCEQMEAHMARCARCAKACDRLKDTVRMCSRSEGDEVPAPIAAAVRRALRGAG
jgi:RNA polymerase sigma-70 factor (ECF subfamily)